MNKKRSILFISHDASRTGAPIVLSRLLKWLSHSSKLKMELLLIKEGPIKDQFESILPVTTFFPKQIISGFIGGLLWFLHKRRIQKKYFNKDLIYINSTASIPVLVPFIKRKSSPIILHIHELEISVRQFSNWDNMVTIIPFIDKFIAPSNAVRIFLETKFNIPDHLIDVVPECVDIEQGEREHQGSGPLRVGLSGTMDWRKGFDLLPLLVKTTHEQNKDILFTWVGGSHQSIEARKVQFDLTRFRVNDQVTFIDSHDYPLDTYRQFDVFVLLSREDPFPLVCLETAALGIPIICFEGSGGMPEFVENDAGWIIPYLDINVLASQLNQIEKQRDLIDEKGRVARSKALKITAEKVASIIENIIFSTLENE